MIPPLRIAFVKQDVYQDLYVGNRENSAEQLLFSSIMRVGPIGLFTLLNADFFIVREEEAEPCHAWEKIIPHYPPAWFRELKTTPFARTSFPEAKFLVPGSDRSHGDFSVPCASVDWAAYDVVISINFSIPTSMVQRHRQVLWCYMVGEANVFCDRVHFGYDVCLNQETRGIVSPGMGVIDFPYTFLGSDCLEQTMGRILGRPSIRRGIFAEINSFVERPVLHPGHLQPLESTGHPVLLHRQSIRENLSQLYDAKYFVKVGGRKIRGNSVLEAISSGAVVLMNPAELHHSQFLPPESWIYSVEDARAKIAFFESHPSALEALRTHQRSLLKMFSVDLPLESLRNALYAKRNSSLQPTTPPPSRPAWKRFASGVKRRLLK